MSKTMYDTLLLLPLFQGISERDFTKILEKVKFHFEKYAAGQTILQQDGECSQLVFLLSGRLFSKTVNSCDDYTLYEYLEGPAIIEPYSLFGMYPYYTADYTAETDCCIVTIEKAFVLDELSKYDVFKMNFYNMLSNRAQSMRKRLLVTHGGSTQEKIIAFLNQRCDRAEGKKVLCIKMEILAGLINDTRLNVSKALKEFQTKELIKVNRKIFTIPNFEQLIASYE